MTISYIITPKDANIITSPYADVTEKLLPSITFIADAGDLLPVIEPIVTVVYTFTDLTFAELGEFFLPIGVDKVRLSPTQIQYSGKFTVMSPLFGQGVDESNIFLAYDETTFAGATFFKNVLVDVEISDSVGTTPVNESWQWTPPFVVTNNEDVLEYNINTPRTFSDIFQFENLQPTIDDNWNFELFCPIYDHSQTLIGSFDLDPGFVSPNSFLIEDAIGPYSNLGQFFGTLGPNNDFFYEFKRDTVFYWTKDVEQLLEPSFVKNSLVARSNDIPRGIHIENIYSADNKMFIYYKENRDLVDYYEFDGSVLVLKQTITLPTGFVRVENILDGNNSKIFDPAVFLFKERLFIFAGIRESDSVEVWKFNGSIYSFESSIALDFLPYRAVYWMSDRTFMYMTHDVDNADDPVDEEKFLHKPKLRIYRRTGTTWAILNEIDFFTTETIQNFRQNGLTPFDRIVTPGRGITEATISSALQAFDFGSVIEIPVEFENLGQIVDFITESINAGLIVDSIDIVGLISGIVSIDDFFIIWFDSVQGDLYRHGGVSGTGTSGFEKIKTIDKSYPGHNFNNTVLAFDSTFTLFPSDLASGPSEFGYRLGKVSSAFNILSNILVRDRQYWFQSTENQGWVSHYTTFGSDNSIFKFKRINDVFWGSIKRKFVTDLSFNDINELLVNLIYTQPTGFDKEFPIYWTLTNARDNSFFTGDTFNLRKIIDLAFVTPAGIIAIISEFDNISEQVEAIDPTDIFATITYSLISGALPTGAVLNPTTGEITGFNVFVTVDTPFTFEIEATNGIKMTIREFIIVIENVNVAPIWSTPVGSLGVFSDQNGLGSPISIFVLATDADGPGPLTYALQSGLLPGGLSLNTATGEISGVLDNVTSVILFVFTIRASDTEAFTDRTFSITVTDNNEPPLWSTAPGLLGTVLSTNPINFLLVASDGDGPAVLSYALTAGSLPTGATLNTSTGLISGPPIPTVGLITFDFVIGASDGLTVVDRFFSIEVTDNISPIWITSPGLIGTVTENTLSTLSVEAIDPDGPNPIQYSVLTGNFPGEFTLDTFNGDITGTARNVTSDEIFNFTLRADDSATIPADRAFSLTITNDLAAPVWITSPGSLGNVHETLPVNLFVQATDGDLGIDITYVRISGTLPTGSILDTNTGDIVGPPLAVATDTVFTFVIRATNGAGSTDRSFSITIKENLAPVWQPPPILDKDLGVTITPNRVTMLALDPDLLPNPIVYSLVGGGLPTGIVLNSNGDLVGTLGALATANVSAGEISSITVIVPAGDDITNSYVIPPIVTIIGGGTIEVPVAVVVPNISGGSIISMTVELGGSGYITSPSIIITSADGVNAVAIVNVSGGEVVSITMTNGGTGYSDADIVIGDPNEGSGATAVANLTSGAVSSITVTNPGSGYNVPSIKIEGPEALIGLYPFTARADDGLEFTDEDFIFKVQSLNIAPSFLTVIGNIATFTEGEFNSVNVIATDPNPDDLILTYDIISGSLPLGLTLGLNTGEITGTVPEGFGQAGDHAFTMRVRDRIGNDDVLQDTRSFTITVALAFFIPQNAILAYEGTVASIPVNWTLCDGTSGTPDLSDRFIMGTDGVSFTQNQIGGSSSTAIAGVTNTTGDHNPLTDNGSAGGGDPSHMQNPAGAHSHTVTGNVSNVPPSFKLAYIMATADNSLLPTGSIVWFDDTIANIPANYTEKTELRDRQIHGVTNDSRTTIGALAEAISVTTNTVGSHNHIIAGAGNNSATSQNIPFANTGAHAHTGASSVVVKDRPPFLALTALRVATNTGIEIRCIIAYNDDPINLPVDWLVCNGGSGTPDLRAKIPVGANSSLTLGDTGGVIGDPIITGGSFNTIVPHSHSTGINTRAGAGSHALFNWDSIHTWTSNTNLDLPPHHTLHYIMFDPNAIASPPPPLPLSGDIGNSLIFNDDDGSFLSRTMTVGNGQTFTWSGWVKRGNIGSNIQNQHFDIFTISNGGLAWFGIILGDTTDKISIHKTDGSRILTTNLNFRNVSAWHHLMFVVDTTNPTSSNRMKLYVDGARITSFTSEVQPSLNENLLSGLTNYRVGTLNLAVGGNTKFLYDGYIAEANFIDGQALEPTDFGEFVGGCWVPIDISTFAANPPIISPVTPSMSFGGPAANIVDGSFATTASTGSLGFLNAVPINGRIMAKLDLGSVKDIAHVKLFDLVNIGSGGTFDQIRFHHSLDGTTWTQFTSQGNSFGAQLGLDDHSVTQNVSARYVAAIFDAVNWSNHNYRFSEFRVTEKIPYGTNGFRLDFAVPPGTGNGGGTDVSGNENHFTDNGLVAADQTIDSPTHNYCVLNSLHTGASTVSNGNLTLQCAQGDAQSTGTFGVSSGKFYFEITVDSVGAGTSSSSGLAVGITNRTDANPNLGVETIDAYAFRSFDGRINPLGTGTVAYGTGWDIVGRVIGVALDLDNGKIWFSINGVFQAGGNPVAGTGAAVTGIANNTTWFPVMGDNSADRNPRITANFGQKSFAFTSPSGFLSWNTDNFPTPTLIQAITNAGITANLQYALDAGDSASYSGTGQSWLDTSGNGQDFFRGLNGSPGALDPTFNGAAGGQSCLEFWSFDDDMFTYDSALTAMMSGAHLAGANFTLMMVVNLASTTESNVLTGSREPDPGIIWAVNGSSNHVFVTRRTLATTFSVIADNKVPSNTLHFFAVSINEGGTGFLYRNGEYDQVGSSDTFPVNYSGPSGSAGHWGISRSDAHSEMSTGSKVYMTAAWNTALTKGQLDAVFAGVRSRFGL